MTYFQLGKASESREKKVAWLAEQQRKLAETEKHSLMYLANEERKIIANSNTQKNHIIRWRKKSEKQLAKGITTKSTNRDKRCPIILHWLLMVYE